MNDEIHQFLIFVMSSTKCIRYHVASCPTGAFDLWIEAKPCRKCENQISEETVHYELYGIHNFLLLDMF